MLTHLFVADFGAGLATDVPSLQPGNIMPARTYRSDRPAWRANGIEGFLRDCVAAIVRSKATKSG
jgi:hypothetical protein